MQKNASISRRSLLASAAATAMLGPTMAAAQASAYPNKPVRWIVGYPPGGGSDTVARVVGEGMATALGQPVVVDNKPGASANIGGYALASAAPDGYTVMNPDNGLLIFNPVLYPKMGFTPSKDMVPVGKIGRLHLIIAVSPNHPAKSFRELLDLIRASKEPVQYAASSVGSPLHLAMVRLAKEAQLDIRHIPYRGAAPAISDFLGGVVNLMCIDYSTAAQYVNTGKMRVLAVTSGTRIAALPQVPTVLESGYQGFEAYAWHAMVVPKGTPLPVITRLNGALNQSLRSKAVVDKLAALAFEVTPSTPEDLAQMIQQEQATWVPIVRSLGITLD